MNISLSLDANVLGISWTVTQDSELWDQINEGVDVMEMHEITNESEPSMNCYKANRKNQL